LTELNAKTAYTKEAAIAGANVLTTFGRKNSFELAEARANRELVSILVARGTSKK